MTREKVANVLFAIGHRGCLEALLAVFLVIVSGVAQGDVEAAWNRARPWIKGSLCVYLTLKLTAIRLWSRSAKSRAEAPAEQEPAGAG